MNKPTKKEIEKDLKNVKALEILAKSDGGKLIQEAVRKDLVVAIDNLANKYKELPHEKLVAYCADLRSQLGLLRLFNSAKSNRKFIEEQLNELYPEEGHGE